MVIVICPTFLFVKIRHVMESNFFRKKNLQNIKNNSKAKHYYKNKLLKLVEVPNALS